MKRGFTLVELSIVLVIIGLLIGGILAAQSMVDNAKINSQITQLQQIDAAMQNFYTAYKRLPGDRDASGLWHNPGATNQPSPPRMYDGEITYIFEDMSVMQGFPGNYSSASTGIIFGTGKKHPFAAIGRGGIFGIMNVRFEPFWAIYADKNCVDADSCSVDAFTPAQALALDSKLDDGNGFSGNVGIANGRAPSSCVLGQFFCGNTKAANPDDYAVSMDGSGSCADQTSGEYLTAISTTTCGLQFKSNVVRN